MFYNAPSVLIVFGGAAFGFFVKNNWSDLIHIFKCVFGHKYENSVSAAYAVRLASNLYNRIITFSLIGTILGIALMFRYLEDPDALGPGMSVALIIGLYGVIIINVINAAITAARRQLHWFGEDEKPNYILSPPVYVLLTFGVMLSAFFILLFLFKVG